MSLPKLKLRIKVPLFFIAISLIPLLIINAIWFTFSKNEITNITSSEVKAVSNQALARINNFFATKLTSLIVHSQTESVLSQNIPNINTEFQGLLVQDSAIEQLQLLDKSGKEIVRVTRKKVYKDNELTNQSGGAAFRVTTYVGGSRYISSPFLNEENKPVIEIAIPVIAKQIPQSLQSLSTSSIGKSRKPGEILGVVIERVYLDNLWKIINALTIGQHGYVYIVDNKGFLINHPKNQLPLQKDLSQVDEVGYYLSTLSEETRENKTVNQTINEIGEQSLTIYQKAQVVPWAVIAQVPLSDSLFAAGDIIVFIATLFLITFIFVVLLSLSVSYQIVRPIEDLQKGSNYLGQGNLSYRLNIKSGDEIEELARSFNNMASNVEESFKKLAQQKIHSEKSAELLLRRDLDLRKINDELEIEKENISAERNKLAVILAGITDSVIALDLQRNIIAFNIAAEKLTGFLAKDVMGKSIDAVIKVFDQSRELSPSYYCPIRLDGFEGEVFHKQGLRVLGQNGKESFVNLIAGQIKEGAQANLGCILTLHDKTAEKRLEEMKLDFISMAAHELRTPLTSIRGYLSVFIKENQDKLGSEQKVLLDHLANATQRLTFLISDLLSVTHIEKGTFSIQPEVVNWLAFVKQTVSDVTGRAKEKQVQVMFIESSFQPVVKVDKVRIGEVLSNLLNNAITYTNTGGMVKVWIEQKDNNVVTYVADTGIGIPAEAIPHLFTKFYRVSTSLQEGIKGTGLGLYISKTIVEKHGGAIWVTSELGKGSTFSFSLPLDNKK